jgi:hypothetical protein
MRRRDFLALIPAGAAAQTSQAPQTIPRIYLDEYQPKSELVVAAHPIARARFPIINVHTHLNAILQLEPGATAERIDRAIEEMDKANIRTLLHLTGGAGDALKRAIAELQNKRRGRFLVCTEPSYSKYADRDLSRRAGEGA